MMYFILLLVVCALGWFYWSSIPPQSSTGPIQNVSSGVISYGKVTLDSLQGNGLVTLDGTIIKGKLEVNGSLKASNAQLGSFVCNGHANLQDCQVQSESRVNGFLNATRSVFGGAITVGAQNIEFTDCMLESIVVTSPGWVLGSQVVELKGATIVKGPITFESGRGKVEKSPQATLSGKITGGELG